MEILVYQKHDRIFSFNSDFTIVVGDLISHKDAMYRVTNRIFTVVSGVSSFHVEVEPYIEEGT